MLLSIVFLSGCDKGPPAAYRYTPGEKHQYRLWLTQQAEMDGNRTEANRLLARLRMQMETVSVSPEGVAEITLSFPAADASISTKDKREPLPQIRLMERSSMTLRMDAKGRILDLVTKNAPPEQAMGFFTSLKLSIREFLPTLPEHLNRGTTWSRTSRIRESLAGAEETPMETVTSFEVLGDSTLDGQSMTEINARFDITVNGENSGDENKLPEEKPAKTVARKPSPEPSNPYAAKEREKEPSISFKATGTGSGKIYFQKETGWFQAASYDTVIQATSEVRTSDSLQTHRQVIRSHIKVTPIRSPERSEESAKPTTDSQGKP